jgi:phosphoglycerate-specific signal transduction histidine kinase
VKAHSAYRPILSTLFAMSKNKHASTSSHGTRPLLKALNQNDGVEEVVKQSAYDLLVINAVLKKNIPEQSQMGDLAQALDKTEHIEDKIQESAEELGEVNTLLEHEVDERIALERELLVTKNALAQAKTELAKK